MIRIKIVSRRMFQYSPISFTKKVSSSRHKSTDVQDYCNESHQTNFSGYSPYVNKALRIKHRKNKTGMYGQELQISPTLPKIINEKKIRQYALPFSDSLQDNFSSKIARKTTSINISQSQQIDANKDGSYQVLKRTRSKKSWKKEQKNTQQMFNSHMLIKFHNRLQSKKKIKQVWKDPSKLHKISNKKLNQTAPDFQTNPSETDLVNLISKFKFENLKNFQEQPECLTPKKPYRQIQSHKSELFAPFECEMPVQKKEMDRQKFNKTMIKIGSTSEADPSKLVRPKSSLTPWQLDIKEPESPIDIF